MKQLIVFVTMLCLISCGSGTRHIEKSSATVGDESSTIDKSTQITTRSLDTLVKTRAESVKSVITAADLNLCLDSVIRKVTKVGALTLTTEYNKNTKTFSAEADKDSENIPVQIHETTVRQNDITIQEKHDSTGSIYKKDTQRKAGTNWTAVWIVGAIIVGLVILVIALIKLPKIYNIGKKPTDDGTTISTSSK